MQTRASNTQPFFLRAIYQMNGKSGTLEDEWTDLGAQVINGTKGDVEPAPLRRAGS